MCKMKRHKEILLGYVISYLDVETDCVVYVKNDDIGLSEIEVTGDYSQALKLKTYEEAERILINYIQENRFDIEYVKNKKFCIEELVCKTYPVKDYTY